MGPAKVISIIFLFIFGILLYSNTLNSTFHFDDISFIESNYSIRDAGNLKGLWDYWPTRFTGILSFALNYRLHQLQPFGYHLINLLIHILSSIALFWLIQLTFSAPAIKEEWVAKKKNCIAFLISFVFLAHPVQTEAVNYVFQRVTLLAALFYLTSLCLYIKAGTLCYFLSLAAALAAMFSKEIAFTLPFAILLYDYCFLRTKRSVNWRRVIPFFAMLPVIPLTILITKPLVFMNIEKLFENPAVNLRTYIFTELRVFVTYLRLFFLPLNQNLDYDYPVYERLWEIPVLLSFLFSLFIIISGFRIFRRSRLISFGIFWFFITLLPESSIIPLLDVIYEHRLYLPMVGCSIAAVCGVYQLLGGKRTRLATAILLFAAICFSALSYKRNWVWKDEFTLWNDVVTKSPNKLRPYNERGLAYLDKGDYDKAAADFTKTVTINTVYAEGYYNRGLSYFKKADYDKAIPDFTRAIKLKEGFQKAYYNRGLAFYIKKEYSLAVLDFEKVLLMTPDFSQAYYFLCSAYSACGNSKEASDCHRRAGELKKNRIFRLDELGQAFVTGAKFKEAIEAYKKILEIEPNLAAAHNNLAVAYYYDRQYDLAVKHIEIAQQLGYKVSPEFLGLIEPHRKK